MRLLIKSGGSPRISGVTYSGPGLPDRTSAMKICESLVQISLSDKNRNRTGYYGDGIVCCSERNSDTFINRPTCQGQLFFSYHVSTVLKAELPSAGLLAVHKRHHGFARFFPNKPNQVSDAASRMNRSTCLLQTHCIRLSMIGLRIVPVLNIF